MTSSPTSSSTASPTSSSTASPTPTTVGPISGPDVASYQHPATAAHPHGKPINWNAVARDGMEFGIVKASESTTYKNPFFDDDYAAIPEAGLVRGSYHFARPGYPLGPSAKAQADYFAHLIGDVNTPATLPPALDLEVTGGLPRADLVTWAQIFLYRLRTVTGRTPMLYTYPSFWTDVLADPSAFSRFPLWMASYCHPVPGCAPKADLWQFTSSASISGISGGVDESRYVGTRGISWDTLSDGTASFPWPAAAPSPPQSVAVTAGPTTATVSWLPGNDGSARTKSYTVTSDPGNITAKVNGASTSATVTGLDPATSYTFTVTAKSAAGTSAPSAPTEAITPVVPTLLSMTQPASISYGHTLKIDATLTRTDTSAGVGGQDVRIYRRAPGHAKWKRHGTATTASDGSLTVKLHPKRSLGVRLKFKGASGYEPDAAKGATVVRYVVAASLSKATVKHRHHAKITGSVAPAIDGDQVVRQDRIGSTWRDGPTRAVRADGTFSFKLHPKKKNRTLR
ncbi:MAG TPA: GH25 family lysozyme, partial [Mycobacteriales bacterium]|nr:GH25 family lysozyme [Mycobacteriales bacterium]